MPAVRVDLHLLMADLAVQRLLIHPLDAALADEPRRAVIDRIEHSQIASSTRPIAPSAWRELSVPNG